MPLEKLQVNCLAGTHWWMCHGGELNTQLLHFSPASPKTLVCLLRHNAYSLLFDILREELPPEYCVKNCPLRLETMLIRAATVIQNSSVAISSAELKKTTVRR